MITNKIRLIILLTLIALSITKSCKPKEDKQNNNKTQAPIKIDAIICNAVNFNDEINITGRLMANEEVELKNEINGRVSKILFQEGMEVKKGDLLVKINDKDLQAQLKQLKLELEQSKKDVERKEKLFQINGVSEEEYEIANNNMNIFKAKIEYLEAQIEKTEIRAAFDGVMGLREISEGTYLSQLSKIATLIMNNPIKIEFNIPERYAAYIKKGTQISFESEDNPKTYNAELYAYETKIDAQTRTIKAKAKCNNDGRLRPGGFVKIKISLKQLDKTIMVPSNAVIPGLNTENIFIVNGNKIKITEIETGIRTDSMIQIIRGVNVGDTIATTGIMQIKDGIAVEILKILNAK